MLDSRNKWTFFTNPTKRVISPSETVYWKNTLKKILKCGMEFEFNLPNKNGSCHGNSDSCPCANMEQHCWEKCASEEKCSSEPVAYRCEGYSEDKCKDLDCNECGEYKLVCHGIFCSSFISYCFSCDDFTTQCEGCENLFDPSRSPEHIREDIIRELQPSHSYGTINGAGIHSITTDGSLLGGKGAEVITIGRRVDYWEFYNMAKRVIDTSVGKGAYMNERCSIHMHLLASYYSKMVNDSQSKTTGIPSQISELERPMPEIILANFHQLVRRYQNAMTWMTMALDEPERMTRWEKFRVSVIEISAALSHMSSVKDEVSHTAGGNKYGWVNYKYTNFNKDGDVSRLHLELRVADGIISPTIVAAVGCMYYALMIKAVEISKYGVVEVGDKAWMKQTREVKKALLNNMKGYGDGDRFGDTSNLGPYYNILIMESLELVRQLKHILIQVGPAYQILEQLAERPVALRRCDGDSWQKIEEDFAVPLTEEGRFETLINEYIDLRLISQCKNIEEWITAATKAIQDEQEELEIEGKLSDRIMEYVDAKRTDGELIWSDSMGTVVLL